jgi:hypothetical protein
MNGKRASLRALLGASIVLAPLLMLLSSPDTTPAVAQATRTWVSGVGDDANACSRTAPCKTFPGAISKTAAGGEINVLDHGSYGAVTITKAITIAADGKIAGIAASGTNGIIVNAGTNDVVVLRGLNINGLGSGLNGIRFLAGKALFLENTIITGFTPASSNGIEMEVAANAELFVTNAEVRNTGGAGIFARATNGSAIAKVTLSNVRLLNNGVGLDARDSTRVGVKNSVASGNSVAGFRAQADSTSAELAMDDSASTHNQTGIVLGQPGVPVSTAATLIIGTSAIWGNASGAIDQAANSVFRSGGDNRIVDESQPGPAQPDCNPRPRVSVTTAQNGAGQLRVTVSAATNGGGATNTIQSLNFGAAANARIDVPNGPANSTGNVNQPQPANTTEVTFNIRRIGAGAFTVPFTVVDGCGNWPTFAGGGAAVP